MADVTVGTVTPQVGAYLVTGTAGEAIDAGQAVYKKQADGKYYVADCATSSATAWAQGIAATTAASPDDPITIQTRGAIALGTSVVTKGLIYYLHASGAIRPASDAPATNDYITVIGVASSANNITLAVTPTSIQAA